MMRLLACCVGVALIGVAAGCSEPGKRVTAATADGDFEVTLTARKNWLRPGETLPIRLRVESLAGQLATTAREPLTFVVNNGTVSPSLLTITFVGRNDSLSIGVERVYEQWVSFSLSSYASPDRQGEIHALFRDIQATLKIRIVADE